MQLLTSEMVTGQRQGRREGLKKKKKKKKVVKGGAHHQPGMLGCVITKPAKRWKTVTM